MEKEILDKLEVRLNRLFSQTHTVIAGRKIKLTKRAKISRANKLIDAALDGEIDIIGDGLNQTKLIDRESGE